MIEAEEATPEYDPDPEPNQRSKAQPEDSAALIVTEAPASYQPEPGKRLRPMK